MIDTAISVNWLDTFTLALASNFVVLLRNTYGTYCSSLVYIVRFIWLANKHTDLSYIYTYRCNGASAELSWQSIVIIGKIRAIVTEHRNKGSLDTNDNRLRRSVSFAITCLLPCIRESVGMEYRVSLNGNYYLSRCRLILSALSECVYSWRSTYLYVYMNTVL